MSKIDKSLIFSLIFLLILSVIFVSRKVHTLEDELAMLRSKVDTCVIDNKVLNSQVQALMDTRIEETQGK